MHSYDISSDINGSRLTLEDENDWQEKSIYDRRHDGLYKSRLEQMQEEWLEESQDSDM
jgi:hypothetical protein